MGAELICPACNLPSWIALDQLQQQNICDLCGGRYDGTRQLVNGEFRYRRTGVLGLEKNAQGAVAVALVLQQLSTSIRSFGHDEIYIPSFELEPKDGVDLPRCEIDFMAILPGTTRKKAHIILAECKDEGGTIDAADVENLRRIADALPKNRFDVFVLLAKLAPFTETEIELAKTLNGDYEQRVIMLTARELEPYHLYERVEKELGIKSHAGSADELANVTSQIYFPKVRSK